ncbi:hypothetical protein [Wolbachia endosymbiont of Wuchereria bancrofti]|uniref:hypothetical protein n=1 Tax=Wolbachia endosymbiont of Wuchereria bancrofti TaxID=96496 RepID=UPI001FEC39A2|nr:hypothetical protein [Wolbachia endosymbiont of Wuchereria bancrofti]
MHNPHRGKKQLFEALSEQVGKMDFNSLGLAIDCQGLQKEVNKKLFIKLIEGALIKSNFLKNQLRGNRGYSKIC